MAKGSKVLVPQLNAREVEVNFVREKNSKCASADRKIVVREQSNW